MSNRNSNLFADPEDSQLVADAKKIIPDPVPYNYTEVGKIRTCYAERNLYTSVACFM